jgi:hypothetical protein
MYKISLNTPRITRKSTQEKSLEWCGIELKLFATAWKGVYE